MSSPTDTYLLLRAFVQELTRCGMRAACTSPGSRCTPIVLSLAGEPRLRCYSHIDERCSGFFALGLAKASGLPVAVTCTSGTAVAELYPAVIEAHQARVPLIVLSADRPPELRESGAGQTIDQLKLFGGAAKWFFEVGNHEATPQRLRWVRTLACRSYWTALQGAPGVVHLNFPLREPLLCDDSLPEDHTARSRWEPYLRRLSADQSAPKNPVGETSQLGELIAGARRGLLIAGRHERHDALGQAAAEFCKALGWPLLADPLSRARQGEHAIAHYDALLRDAEFAQAMEPDLILRVGDLPTSKPLRTWLAGLSDATPQVSLDPEGAYQDPDAKLWSSFALQPARTLHELTSTPQLQSIQADRQWLERWRRADAAAQTAITEQLDACGLCEPAVAAELGRLLDGSCTLFVASSMPVRDIETFWAARGDPPRVLCNRGANGIDGTISSAFGASASDQGPVVLLIGDVAFAHDLGGLLAARRLNLKLTIVLLNNGGGGIFDFLAVSGSQAALKGDLYTTHIATPTGLDFSLAGSLYGLAYVCVQDIPSLQTALEGALAGSGSSIIEVRSERTNNVAVHRQLWEAVKEGIASVADGAPSPQ